MDISGLELFPFLAGFALTLAVVLGAHLRSPRAAEVVQHDQPDHHDHSQDNDTPSSTVVEMHPPATLAHSGAADHAPLAIWSQSDSGKLIGGNAVFDKLVTSDDDTLFDPDRLAGLSSGKTARLQLQTREAKAPKWFDVTAHVSGAVTTFYAVNVDATVSAEAAQRKFVQTLTKTFAQLSTGLAIFDRNRQLALFNPALIDLTLLPADMLSGRPTIGTFFDQLRDRQIMPEPRNYKSWREQLSDMLSKAEDGVYCETWTLPSGLTYRISGKPHPDGAVAFLFEDISAEISLTRRFRAELELSQNVIEALDTAVAVFARSGTLTFTNRRFREMWKCNPDESFIEMTILDAARLWQEAGTPSPVWGELRNFVTSLEDRADWSDEITHNTEGALRVDASPLTGGASLIRFTPILPARSAPKAAVPVATEV